MTFGMAISLWRAGRREGPLVGRIGIAAIVVRDAIQEERLLDAGHLSLKLTCSVLSARQMRLLGAGH